MGLGILLHASHPGRSISPSRIEGLLRRFAGDCLLSFNRGVAEDGVTPCWALLHPGAEEVEFRLGPPGRVAIEAKTSTVGPGYHVWLCGLVRRMGEALRFTWLPNAADDGDRDETGYFDSGRVEDCEREMEAWVRALCASMLEREDEFEGLMLSMPMGEQFLVGNAVVTPLGTRDEAWMRIVAADGRQGRDFFAWWDAASEAEHRLGRALVEMWRSVRWRRPQTPGERALNRRVLADLRTAFALDPSLDYPFPEWKQLLLLSGSRSNVAAEVARRAKSAPRRPLVGYRRGPVRVELAGGWSVVVPGSFSVEMEDESTWLAWEGDRTVRVSSFRLAKQNGREASPDDLLSGKLEGEVLTWAGRGVKGRGELVREKTKGASYYRLTGQTAAPGRLGVCTICFSDPEDRPWAIGVWHSLELQGTEEEEE